MNRKTILIILAVVGVLCICGVVAVLVIGNRLGKAIGSAVSNDPAAVQESASKIVDFDLPPSWTEAYSMSLMGVTMAGFASGDGETITFLFQMPSGTDTDSAQIQEQMRQMAEGQTNQSYSMQLVETRPITVRGQTVDLLIYQGTNSEGVSMQQWMTSFEGKTGPAWLMIIGSTAGWDQAGVDAFISSLR